MLQAILEQKLQQEFEPSYLEVLNESYMHNVPAGSESHFKLVIVSKKFEGLRLIARHRLVNGLLAEELAGSIHALSMHTFTDQEWQEKNNTAPDSPMCLGGGKS
ncbi:transcriptional regulator BolA [Vibrio sonorensis]|uniref:transcriptional regulator BolA n=1 Tax=Vibrio sonorensis TaxID=1004316 RepID=UPI0008DAD8F2|nr:transcriptional regulator BolA [Vibrio sonorensis]